MGNLVGENEFVSGRSIIEKVTFPGTMQWFPATEKEWNDPDCRCRKGYVLPHHEVHGELQHELLVLLTQPGLLVDGISEAGALAKTATHVLSVSSAVEDKTGLELRCVKKRDAIVDIHFMAKKCARCDTSLKAGGMCGDETCPFSDVAQSDPRGWAGHPNPPPQDLPDLPELVDEKPTLEDSIKRLTTTARSAGEALQDPKYGKPELAKRLLDACEEVEEWAEAHEDPRRDGRVGSDGRP